MVWANRSRRTIVVQILRTAGIVTAVLLLNGALLWSAIPYGPFEEAGLAVAVVAAEVGLCSVWAIIGRDFWLARLATALAAWTSVWMFLHNWHRLADEELLPGCWVQAVLVVGALLGLRVVGFRLVRFQTDASGEPSAPIPRFSIRDIMIFTTLVGFALAAVIRLGSLTVGRDASLLAEAVGAFLAFITLLSVLSTLALRQSVLPALLTCGASVLLGWGVGTAIRYDRVVSTLAIGAPAGLQVAVLMFFRQAGYRFMRPTSATLDDGSVV